MLEASISVNVDTGHNIYIYIYIYILNGGYMQNTILFISYMPTIVIGFFYFGLDGYVVKKKKK